jgi:hypothetical protein
MLILNSIFLLLLIQTINSYILNQPEDEKKCSYLKDIENKNEILDIFMKYPIVIIKNNDNNIDLLNIFNNLNIMNEDIIIKNNNEIILNQCIELNNKDINKDNNITNKFESLYKIKNITIIPDNNETNNKLWQLDNNEKICKLPIFINEDIILEKIKDKNYDFLEDLKFSSKNLYSLIYKDDDDNNEKNRYLRGRNQNKKVLKYDSVSLIENKINQNNEKISLPLIFSPEINNELPTIIIMPIFFYKLIYLNLINENLIIHNYFIIFNSSQEIVLYLMIYNFCIQIYLSEE